jgi:hypothetical protein
LGSFSNLDLSNQDFTEESLYVEPNEPEPEQTESEPTEVESAPELEPEVETENTSPEPSVFVASQSLKSESKDVELPVESEPEQSLEPETTQTDPPETNKPPVTPPVQKNYSEPVLKAINYLLEQPEPEAVLWLDVLNRRFGIDEFTHALQNFEYLMAWSPDKSYVNLFRRMADYGARTNLAELGKVTNELDLITLPALYCDRLALPANYSTLLIDGANEGGYKLTHVLLGWIWLQENGGEVELPEGFIDDMYQANADLINIDDDVADLELEAAAFLCLAGQNELVDESFFDHVIAAQEADGSWGGATKRWHTTVLGLMYLLHIEFPSNSYPPVLAPSSD